MRKWRERKERKTKEGLQRVIVIIQSFLFCEIWLLTVFTSIVVLRYLHMYLQSTHHRYSKPIRAKRGSGRRVSPVSSHQKEQRIEKRCRLIQVIALQLKNKNVDGGMIPFGGKTMRQNNKKRCGWNGMGLPSGRRRRGGSPAAVANIESKSSAKALKRLDRSTWKLRAPTAW